MPIRLQDYLRTVAPWRAVRLSGRGSLFVTTDDPAISRIGSNPAVIEFSLPTGVLKCSNPIEPDDRTIEGETARRKQMTPTERQQIAEENGLNLQAIEEHLNNPECGQLGQQQGVWLAARESP